MEEFYQHKELTGKIIGAAMQVHNVLGNGFQEVIYQRALAIELGKRSLLFAREVEMPIFYDGQQIGLRRVDFFVQELILVELKAVAQLEKVHLAQGINYLEAFGIGTGLLINFGSASLEFRRLVSTKSVRL
ncbi:MAG TPA: GxxExxY protein [Hymenobacter sp.]|jgi:GxxExxY protein|uniref:GxxExxY protein n=1 Tax=Hymenobacter sp. TaxID=1898978 RepID=UPI002ED7FEFC